ncbi:MAG: Xaa-Pro peptidase family protein [Candidatus Hydrogenedentes bacterium]|nr:Xaa-Pro peptidase family protein [Candidatus Hydrogenedentota bacterium]
MGYLEEKEKDARLSNVRGILAKKGLDAALVYYDEFNIGNGWYLTGWCPQFESGAVLIPKAGKPMLLGGPESEPFAKLDSAITETRNFPVFMVPDEEYPNAKIIDFPTLFRELKGGGKRLKKIGIVGGDRMPAACYRQIVEGFQGVKLIDITQEFVSLRYMKSRWELNQIRAAFALADTCYDSMKRAIRPGRTEIEVAAAGEYAARSRGASGFGFSAIVGSGPRSNAVVPTASAKKLKANELVMIGIAPKVRGYAGVVGDSLPVSGKYTRKQADAIEHLKEVFRLTKAQLVPGNTGKEIDAPGRAYFKKHGLLKYLVCPFAHTIGLHEAEAPFFGPNGADPLKPGMAVCIDISFFGHPEWHGLRIETGYEITAKGPVPFSKKMDRLLTS